MSREPFPCWGYDDSAPPAALPQVKPSRLMTPGEQKILQGLIEGEVFYYRGEPYRLISEADLVKLNAHRGPA